MKKQLSVLLVFMMLTSSVVSIRASFSDEITITPVENSGGDALVKLDKALREEISRAGNSPVDVIFELNANSDQLLSDIANEGGRINQQLENAKIVSATLPADSLIKVSLNDHVQRIYKDEVIQIPEEIGMKGEELLVELDGEEFTIDSIESMNDLVTLMDANAFFTDAYQVWGDTNAGAGSVIAVIDTGVFPHVSLGNRLIGGIDLIDAGTPYEGFDNPNNINHGTFVASQAAGNALITFPAGSSTGDAFLRFSPFAFQNPDGSVSVALLGTAPLASIFAIKVFSVFGYTTTGTILAGIDYAITMGVDVINLSLGGPSNIPGEDLLDLMVDAASAAGIAVTISAGNSGPNPLQIGSPGTAKSAITVGAASTPSQERLYAEVVAGLGDYYYGADGNSIVYFSSRGPTSDGRMKPDVVATGSRNLGAFGYTGLSFGSGTSFSSPVVAGAAALLSSYARLNNMDLSSQDIKDALKAGAVPIDGFSDFEQGAGYINLVNSIAYLSSNDDHDDHHGKEGKHKDRDHDDDDDDHELSKIEDNVEDLLDIIELEDGVYTVSDLTIKPSEFEYLTFEVGDDVDFVRVSISGVSYDVDNPVLGNRAWGYLSSSMPNGIDGNYLDLIFIDTGDNQMFTYSDFDFQAGLLRMTIENDFISFGDLHIASLTIEVVEVGAELDDGELEIENEGADTILYYDVYEGGVSEYNGVILDGEVQVMSFTIPDMYGFAMLQLTWERDYQYYGTDDIDFYVADSAGDFVAFGASLAIPEVDFLFFADTYTIYLVGYDVYDAAGAEYTLEIIYFVDLFAAPIYSSALMLMPQDSEIEVSLPAGVHGVMIVGTFNAVEFFGFTFYLDVWSDFLDV